MVENKFHNPMIDFVQTKENEFSIHARKSDKDEVTLGKVISHAEIDYGKVENFIMMVAAGLGEREGFKYGVFDNIEERERTIEGDVAGTTSRGNEVETGMVSQIYNTTFGSKFGDSQVTTTVQRTSGKIELQRKHSVRFYHEEPDTDEHFNVDLVLKSLRGQLKIYHGTIPNAIWLPYISHNYGR